MRLNKIFFGGILVLFGIIAISGCHHARQPIKPKPSTFSQKVDTSAHGPSAQSVMTHADSTLAHVSQLEAEDRDAAESNRYERPPHAEMRRPWGESYTPRPDMTDYGTYQAALGAYNGRSYDEAISRFSQIVTTGRPPELVPNAYYWMGESFYAEDRYAESMPYFEYVTRVGPQYKREISMFKLSRGALHIGNRQDADMWYERLRNEYPKSHYISTLRKLGAR